MRCRRHRMATSSARRRLINSSGMPAACGPQASASWTPRQPGGFYEVNADLLAFIKA